MFCLCSTRYINGEIARLDTKLGFGITDLVWGAVDSAVAAASEMASSFVDWAKDKVSSMFSNVVDPIVDGLEDWAKGIKTQMQNFFNELSKWATVDGDDSVKAKKQAGVSFMLSFVGQSQSWRKESKTIDMCVKGSAPTASSGGGLFSFTLSTTLPSISTSIGVTGFVDKVRNLTQTEGKTDKNYKCHYRNNDYRDNNVYRPF